MELKMMAIYDAKARAFIAPFFVAHEDVAVRIVGHAVNDLTHAFGKNPEDFQLYKLGSFWDHNGEVLPLLPPQMVCVLSSLRAPVQSVPLNKGVSDATDAE